MPASRYKLEQQKANIERCWLFCFVGIEFCVKEKRIAHVAGSPLSLDCGVCLVPEFISKVFGPTIGRGANEFANCITRNSDSLLGPLDFLLSRVCAQSLAMLFFAAVSFVVLSETSGFFIVAMRVSCE